MARGLIESYLQDVTTQKRYQDIEKRPDEMHIEGLFKCFPSLACSAPL